MDADILYEARCLRLWADLSRSRGDHVGAEYLDDQIVYLLSTGLPRSKKAIETATALAQACDPRWLPWL